MALITCLYIVISIFHWPATPAYFEGIQQNKNIHRRILLFEEFNIIFNTAKVLSLLLTFYFIYSCRCGPLSLLKQLPKHLQAFLISWST